MKLIPLRDRVPLADAGTVKILANLAALARDMRDDPKTYFTVRHAWEKRLGALTRALSLLNGERLPHRFQKVGCNNCLGYGNDPDGSKKDDACPACGGVGHYFKVRRVNGNDRRNGK